MKAVKIDEYLVINLYTGKRRWLTQSPTRKSTYDIVIRVRGTVKIPDSIPIIDFGEISVPDFEAEAQAVMG